VNAAAAIVVVVIDFFMAVNSMLSSPRSGTLHMWHRSLRRE
jgi:hypothetical protein